MDRMELFELKHLKIDLAVGPVLYFIEKTYHFNKPIDVEWSHGARSIQQTDHEFWMNVKQNDPDALIVLNSWIALEPESFANAYQNIQDIRFLGINSPFAQSTAQGIKMVENRSTTETFKIDRNNDLKNKDINLLHCRQCLDPTSNLSCQCKELVKRFQKISKKQN